MEPIAYSKFQLFRPDDSKLDAAPMIPFPMVPSSSFRIITQMNEPAMQGVYEDWFKDNDVEWVYWLDALHFVVSGRAEITYFNPPDWAEEHTVIAEPGVFYLTPRGSRVKWRILSDEPFRHVVFDIPNGGYDTGD